MPRRWLRLDACESRLACEAGVTMVMMVMTGAAVMFRPPRRHAAFRGKRGAEAGRTGPAG